MHALKKCLLLMLLLAGGVYLFWTGCREFRDSRRLAANGKSTAAVVVRDRLGYRHRSVAYYVTIEFKTEASERIRKELEVDYDTYSAARKGEITVHYLPSDPTVCQAGDSVETKFANILIGAALLFFGLVWLVRFKQPVSRAELADVTAGHLQVLCRTDQVYRTVEPRQFKHLDLAFYDDLQRQAEAHGFVFVEDLEEVPAKPVRGVARAFQRLLSSPDKTAVASIAHIKPAWMLKVLGARELRLFGLDTRFSDDTFVCTDNAPALMALNSPPAIAVAHLPSRTSIGDLIKAHLHRVSAHQTSHPEATPVALQGAADIRKAMAQQQRIKAEYRRENGISKSELARMAGVASDPAIDNLHADLERRREAEKSKRRAAA